MTLIGTMALEGSMRSEPLGVAMVGGADCPCANKATVPNSVINTAASNVSRNQ